ncbi:MAG: hypothetical protein GF309_14315 [Candidatus Lokiarchaeota archaeon]|nr:hypothetical protein [Candidatus Lokiarchaeota archaeon]
MKIRKKYPETMEYVTATEWDGKTGGTAKLKESELIFDTPKVYGGRGEGLCPYRLFLSGILGCLNNTLLDVKRRSNLDMFGFALEAKLTVKFDGEGYSISKLRISGKLEVAKSELYLGQRCLELAKKYCPLTRSTKDCVPIEYDIEIEETR